MEQKIATGLTKEEVIENRKKGNNILVATKKDSFFHQFLMTLGDPIIKILLIALGIKMVFLIKDFDWYETVGIVIAIFLASFISTISEYGSEKAFQKLQEESSKIKCRVKRDGKVEEVSIDDIVVGDIVLLSTGDKIPADGVILRGTISVDESALNGETKEKTKVAMSPKQNTPNENNLVYRGTVVYAKEAIMLTTKVGSDTFYGTLAQELQESQPESPLKIKLRGLAKIISMIGYIGAILVSFSYLFSVVVIQNNFVLKDIYATITNIPLITGYILYALTLSVTIIVVAVPEGLPMMITLVLSSNMKRMLKNNVLVRKMIGIETAGSINILFTDKTGTLTKGKLEVTAIIDGDLKRYKKASDLNLNDKYRHIIELSFLNNNESVYSDGKVIGGNITDQALVSFFKKSSDDSYKVLKVSPFDSKNKYASTTLKKGKEFTLIKGAPEKILPYCTYYFDGKNKRPLNKRKIEKVISEATKKGIRVLLLALKEESINFLGLVLIKDEIRKEAIAGLKLVESAHIKTVMITGDNKDTALAIAKEVGLVKQSSDVVLTSLELSKMTDEQVKAILPNLKVVARSLPQDKSRLVRLSEEMDYVVGMTGDGVNDAPALKKADVGFAMGSGTEVAKEASDIVILDDNFLSIAKAVLYGRTIFKSIRKFIIVQLTINLCAISLSILGPFIGIDTPVTVIQMLWINMVMDTLAGLAFAFEPPLLEYMQEYPKKKDEAIMNHYMLEEIFFTGFYSAILCVLFLKLPIFHQFFRYDQNNIYLMTAFFGLFIFIDIFNSFNARTNRLNLLSNIFKNKVFLLIMTFVIVVQIILIYYGGSLFRTAGLTLKEFEIMILLAFSVIPVDWLRKIVMRLNGRKDGV